MYRGCLTKTELDSTSRLGLQTVPNEMQVVTIEHSILSSSRARSTAHDLFDLLYPLAFATLILCKAVYVPHAHDRRSPHDDLVSFMVGAAGLVLAAFSKNLIINVVPLYQYHPVFPGPSRRRFPSKTESPSLSTNLLVEHNLGSEH